jgi:hypothetical protein
MADSPETILQKLVETALDLCRADSAGISILEPGVAAGVIRWHAIAGQLAPDNGMASDPPMVEALASPFHIEGKPAGALWAIAHTPSRRFDAEDQRFLTSLSRFAAAAYRMKADLKQTTEVLREREQRLRLALDASGAGSWVRRGVAGTGTAAAARSRRLRSGLLGAGCPHRPRRLGRSIP